MEAFFVSAAVIAVAEIGDKTQLLALMLAARYRKPVPITLGILLASLTDHALTARFNSPVLVTLGTTAGMLLVNAPVFMPSAP